MPPVSRTPAGSPALNVMKKVALKAGRSLIRDFNEVEQLQVSMKGPADFVTAADLRTEKLIRDELEKARPGYCYVMEEQGTIEGPDKSHRWYIDPIDGTTNFMHGLPQFCVSIALERDGQLVAGVLYAPVLDELYWAEKGNGAWLNDKRLRVAGRKRLSESLIAAGLPVSNWPGQERYITELTGLMPKVAGVRRFGSAALDLAGVASGRFDGFWERNLKPWDVAAGMLIVREAGGTVTDDKGRSAAPDASCIVAANLDLHNEFLKALKVS